MRLIHKAALERDIEQARADLSAVLAAIRVFSTEGVKVTAYMNLHKLFPRFTLPKLAQEALTASPGGISTVGIAQHIMAAKGLDAGDRYLRKAIAWKVIQVMRRWERERKVVRAGKAGAAVVWKATSA